MPRLICFANIVHTRVRVRARDSWPGAVWVVLVAGLQAAFSGLQCRTFSRRASPAAPPARTATAQCMRPARPRKSCGPKDLLRSLHSYSCHHATGHQPSLRLCRPPPTPKPESLCAVRIAGAAACCRLIRQRAGDQQANTKGGDVQQAKIPN